MFVLELLNFHKEVVVLYIVRLVMMFLVSMICMSLRIVAANNDDVYVKREEAKQLYLTLWKERRGLVSIAERPQHFDGVSVKELWNYAKKHNRLYYLVKFDQLRKKVLETFSSQSLNSLEGIELIPAASEWNTVNFDHNLITTVAAMDSFTHVRHLNLEENRLTVFPAIFKTLQQLERLILKKNSIQDFPHDIDGFEKLIKLDLSYNKIKTIPTDILGFAVLAHLDLNNNEVVVLPERINGLAQLQILNLNTNKITTFIGQPQDLLKLNTIGLSCNSICQIASELHIPGNLRRIYLAKHHLSDEDKKLILQTIAQRVQVNSCELINF